MDDTIKTIGSVEYRFKPANATTSWALTKRFLAEVGSQALSGINPDDENGGTAAFTSLLSKIDSPVMNDMQNFVLKHTVVVGDDGKASRLPDIFDQHFGQHPENLLPVLVEGFKTYFLKYLQGFSGLLSATKL